VTVDEIRELIKLASETGIAELEVQRGENRVRIRRASFSNQQEIVLAPPAYTAVASGSSPAAAAVSAAPPVAPPAVETPKDMPEKPADTGRVLVKSPIVGTFYESAQPGGPAFVNIGDRVKPGKVLCIIESMKLMNEIECEAEGIIESKLVMNGQPVEYGEALFAIRAV
jgi:acetyl-CoA carboxylase biotin carboxyl carrier protein